MDLAGITDALSGFQGHFSILVTPNSSAALSVHSLPPSWNFFLGSVLLHSPSFPSLLHPLAHSSLPPCPPLAHLYVLKFHKAGSQLDFSSNSNFLVVFNNYQFFKISTGWWSPNSNPEPRLPMEPQTHKCNCLLQVSILLSLKYHTHFFVQQTVMKYSVWVWPHLDRSKHISISTNWASFCFLNLMNPPKGVCSPDTWEWSLTPPLSSSCSQLWTHPALFYLLSTSKTYPLLSVSTAPTLESLSPHWLLQRPLNLPSTSLLLPNPFSSCIQGNLFFLNFLMLIYFID